MVSPRSRSRRRRDHRPQFHKALSRYRRESSRSPHVGHSRNMKPNPFEVQIRWKPSESHYDMGSEYGLTLPRHIESTRWSRKLNLAGRPIEEIRAYELCMGMSSNWSLRLRANGLYVAMETFRSRLDAVLWSSVARECYKRSSVDLSKNLEQGRQGNDSQDWSEKMDRIKDVGNKLRDFGRYDATRQSERSHAGIRKAQRRKSQAQRTVTDRQTSTTCRVRAARHSSICSSFSNIIGAAPRKMPYLLPTSIPFSVCGELAKLCYLSVLLKMGEPVRSNSG